jgi:hypothetical protein
MAYFCHFWRMTPDQFWDLDLDDYNALSRYVERYNKQQEKG